MSQQGSAGNVIAALCNVFFPGLGFLVQGRILAAIVTAMLVFGGYALFWLVVPAIIGGLIHLWSIINAATFKGDRVIVVRDE
ncbi:hypothetical protein [Psychrosphaera haliotis]|uniref:Uncharacterized protein n=1 Tax=Psychrosphaera haliotis TaxID=555083 RepID=A0A6N8FDQ4_9GAMM|nr:hypothetical protein [Psychrosphaera haliotis]MUH73287.1 hypothetical protein [Psychrosphaera haliotis]